MKKTIKNAVKTAVTKVKKTIKPAKATKPAAKSTKKPTTYREYVAKGMKSGMSMQEVAKKWTKEKKAK